ncbi:hypothetical protein [Rhodococcus xishaensis]|uniref:hypothetical protein n=1 Tax=Rhodococcus xishaensis TaxID=2487364 RepID=UPI000FDF2D50|nr:hypothetical protein [Rhodococcus xishaensis]
MAELIVIAAALEVPPLLLLYPSVMGGQADWLPGRTASSGSIIRWFDGEAFERDDGHLSGTAVGQLAKTESENEKRRRRGTVAINLSREHLWGLEYREMLVYRIDRARERGDQTTVDATVDRLRRLDEDLAKGIERMTELGMDTSGGFDG